MKEAKRLCDGAMGILKRPGPVWVLDNILGTPPQAPPPNVPAFKNRGEDGKIKSVRPTQSDV
jgi:hypothetical protein